VDASIIIPTFRRVDMLPDVLQDLSSLNSDKPFEVLVVDNEGSEQLKSIVCNYSRQENRFKLKYIVEKRVGLHYARHAGARKARSEILIFIDDDVRLPLDWLTYILAQFEDKAVAAVAGDISLQWARKPEPWMVKRFGLMLCLFESKTKEPTLMKYPQSPIGANMAVRKSVLFEVGLFFTEGMVRLG